MDKFVTLERLEQFGTAMLTKIKEFFVMKEEGKGLSTNDYTDEDKTALSILVGNDTGKSARTIASEELAVQLIPEGAKDSLNTLQEIAAWIQEHPGDAAALSSKLTLGTHEVTTYVPAEGTYVDGTKYYTDSTGETEVDTSEFVAGTTDVSSYYVAQTSTVQYESVKEFVEQYVASNAVAGIETATQQDIDDAVNEIFSEVFPSVTINGYSTVAPSGTITLIATTVPAGKTVTWTSSDTDVATVSSEGVVTGVADGETTITASFALNGSNVIATKQIKVETPEP